MPSGGSSKQTVGYKYYLGCHMGLCHGPIDAITEIQVDKRVAWTGLVTEGTITVDAPTLFGGEKREGGVSGTIDVEMGYPAQLPNAYLQTQLGPDVPAFRGVASLVFNQTYMGNNPYLKPWKFKASRIEVTSNGDENWYVEKATIAREVDCDDFGNSGYQCDSFKLVLAGAADSAVIWDADSEDAGYGIDATGNGNHQSNPRGSGYTDLPIEGFDYPRNCTGRTYYTPEGPNSNDGAFVEIPGSSLPTTMLMVSMAPTTYSGTFGPRAQQHLFFLDGGQAGIYPHWRARLEGPTGGAPDTAIVQFVDSNLATLTATASLPNIYDPDAAMLWLFECDDDLATLYLLDSIEGVCIPVADLSRDPVANPGSFNSPLRYNFGYTQTSLSHELYIFATAVNPTDDCLLLGEGLGRNYEDAAIDCPCSDMNPAHIIRECLTDSVWGMGYSSSDVDDDAFTSAANTLFDEDMGISILWEQEQPIEEFIGEILRHIDAVLYVSRSTGRFVLKLIREEEPSITLDESNVSSVSNARRPTISELTNTVSVTYWEAGTDDSASVTAHNEALRLVQGNEISTAVQYPGFTNKDIAARVAERDLKALSTPLLSCELVASRDAASLNVGDPFTLDWPDLGINQTTMRVDEIDYGDGIDNSIKITAVQDVFSTPASASVADTDEVWVDPTAETPNESVARVVTETPYYPLVLALGETQTNDLLADDPDAGYLLASGGRQGNELNANVQVDAGSGYVNSATADFHPYAYLAGPIGYTDTVLDIESGKDLDLIEIGTIAQIGTELVRVDSVDQDSTGAYVSVTVGRGILDTVPQVHDDGDTIAFWGDFATTDNEQYVSGEPVDVKLQTVQGSNVLDIDEATIDRVVFDSRAIRPYPPGDFKIDSLGYPDPYTWTASHTLTWAHRDRLQQTDGNLYDYTEGHIGPEAGTSYLVEGLAVYRDTHGGGDALRISGEYQWAEGDIALDIGSDDFVIEFDLYFDTAIEDENHWTIIGQQDIAEDFSTTDFSWRITYIGQSFAPGSHFRFTHSIDGSSQTTAKLYPNQSQLPAREFINVRFAAKFNASRGSRDVRLYINGELQDTVSDMAASFHSSPEPVRIGNYGNSAFESWENRQLGANNDDPWIGYFRNLRITVGTPRFTGTTFPESYDDLPPFLGECDSVGLNCDEYYAYVVVLNTFDGDVDGDAINSGGWSLEGATIATTPVNSGPERIEKFLDVDVGSDTEYVFDIDSGTFDSNYSEPPEGTTEILLGVKSRRDGYDSWQYPQIRLQYPGFTDSVGDSVGEIDSTGTPIDSVGDSVGDSLGPTDPNFSDVTLLLHMDGSDGSTTFTDSSSNALTVTAVGNAQIDTAQSKFGGAAGLFDGSGDRITVSSDPAFIFGSGDFTVELWVRLSGGSGNACFAQVRDAATTYSSWGLSLDGSGRPRFVATSQPSAYDVDISSSSALSIGTWYHLAAVRNGSSFVLYVDGVSVASATASITLKALSESFFSGANAAVSPTLYFNGHLDDLRITKGVARYTSNFTPPTAAFPDS